MKRRWFSFARFFVLGLTLSQTFPTMAMEKGEDEKRKGHTSQPLTSVKKDPTKLEKIDLLWKKIQKKENKERDLLAKANNAEEENNLELRLKAIQLKLQLPALYCKLAFLYREAGYKEEAARKLIKAWEISGGTKKGVLFEGGALLFEASGRKKEAAEYFQFLSTISDVSKRSEFAAKAAHLFEEVEGKTMEAAECYVKAAQYGEYPQNMEHYNKAVDRFKAAAQDKKYANLAQAHLVGCYFSAAQVPAIFEKERKEFLRNGWKQLSDLPAGLLLSGKQVYPFLPLWAFFFETYPEFKTSFQENQGFLRKEFPEYEQLINLIIKELNSKS